MKKTKSKDPEIEEFQTALLESIGQMERGEYAAVHTPQQLRAKMRGKSARLVDPKMDSTGIGPGKVVGN